MDASIAGWVGSIGTVIGAIGAVGTLIVALKQIADERNYRRNKERRAQAEKISAWVQY